MRRREEIIEKIKRNQRERKRNIVDINIVINVFNVGTVDGATTIVAITEVHIGGHAYNLQSCVASITSYVDCLFVTRSASGLAQ